MATTADIRNGLVIEFNNDLYSIVEFQHVKPGKGPAFIRTKLKSLKHGRVIANTFDSGAKIEIARVERRKYQYLFKENSDYHFMHTETFEQIYVPDLNFQNSRKINIFNSRFLTNFAAPLKSTINKFIWLQQQISEMVW